jgi:hypothetical protein
LKKRFCAVTRDVMADDPTTPTWLELESVKPLAQVSEITSLSPDTLTRRYPELIVHLSPRRRGMKVRNILKITDGEVV